MKNAFLNEYQTKEELAKFILHTDKFSIDKKCAEFEKTFAKFHGVKEAILYNSGGSANLALLQTLKNLGKLKQGDSIGFSALTWSTNVMPIIQLGFQPVPIDCEPTTLNVMSQNLVDRLKEVSIQAMFITNALGFAGDLQNVQSICNENNIILLEDNCEALGTELDGCKTGTFGSMSTCSFFVAHHMSTIEGGMIVSNDEEFAAMARMVRSNGWDRNLNSIQQHHIRAKHEIKSEFVAKYTFYDLGYNLKPTEITGFLGLQQMQFLKDNIKIREKNFYTLESTVKTNPDLVDLDRSHISLLSSFAFPVLCKSKKIRDQYLSQFAGAGVEIRPMIAGNIQKQPFYGKYVSDFYDLPGTDSIHECGFYCGNYPELSENDLETLSSCLSKY